MTVIDLPTLLEPIGVTLPADMETMVVINCQPCELQDRIAQAVATSPKDWIGAPKPVQPLEDSPIFVSLHDWVQNAPHLLIPLLMPVMTDAKHAAVHQEALRQTASESILKCMLQVEAIQLHIAHFMNAILEEVFEPFADHPQPTFTLPDLHVMCINQLRYLDHVHDPFAFAIS
ncbi:hypothetical protein BCR44DRAFT_1500678 [Catenaria anguillulae PL171]|uniref:Uncharacterized protein n=1 Tax=Catenaria anguillulae PL171 TaxID=765915 RepID=A0A1Y2HI58_9FUNG|nr:hypothetical protein BCR44DRAFT_1500678 [Catenaria anguillulae PL171]